MVKALIKRLIGRTGKVNSVAKSLSYIPAVDTVNAAQKENLSVGDYVERLWDQVGQSDKVVEQMFSIISLPPTPSITEIGTGTGRYLEKLIRKVKPGSYESYEIAADWNEYLRSEYKDVKFHQADGSTLSSTADRASDLVIAHGVFTYLPFLVAVSYFKEIDRVVRIGGYCVFDCCMEDCFAPPYLGQWLKSEHRYPTIMPEAFTKNWFSHCGFSFIGGFPNKYGQGISQYLVFQKNYE